MEWLMDWNIHPKYFMSCYVSCRGLSDRHHHFDKASIATFGKILDGELPLPTHRYISETL